MELETNHITSFCSLCGKFIGSVEIVEGSETHKFYMQNPICTECFKEKGLVSIKALVADIKSD